MTMHDVTIEQVKAAIRNVPDFPKPGIQFKDITTALKDPKLFSYICGQIAVNFIDRKITKVAVVESRGFIAGGAIACRLNAGFVPIRKKGKLPADVYSKSFALEYGTDTIELHKDALTPDDVVLLHDDLLATGGTCNAAIDLIKACGVKTIYCAFICELDFLNGRKALHDVAEVYSLLHY